MEKPITMRIEDFRKNIEDIINGSGLPWWKIQDELELSLLPQIRGLAIKERQLEIEEYQNKIKERGENNV